MSSTENRTTSMSVVLHVNYDANVPISSVKYSNIGCTVMPETSMSNTFAKQPEDGPILEDLRQK